jgi:sec-independent protein translocase protein TatA
MPGPMELMIILAIVLLLFGTKKLKGMGGDLGGAIKNFKTSIKSEDGNEDMDKYEVKENKEIKEIKDSSNSASIDGEIVSKKESKTTDK